MGGDKIFMLNPAQRFFFSIFKPLIGMHNDVGNTGVQLKQESVK